MDDIHAKNNIYVEEEHDITENPYNALSSSLLAAYFPLTDRSGSAGLDLTG